MNTKTHIKCACGQRVVSKDVLTTGYLLHSGSQVFVFVKFRCPHCKKLGKEVISRERWDWSVLEDDTGEMSGEEKLRFEALGPIQLDELLEFHRGLNEARRFSDESAAGHA